MSAFSWLFQLTDTLWESDNSEIASAIFEMADASGDGDTATVEAVYPVLIGFAREQKMPWVELFTRHMRQQAYLNQGNNAGVLLPEVVETVAMTLRDDMHDCPQRVCAIQDLSICYGAIDAPGYAEARLAAVDDILAGLDPHIECATCLLSERTQALCSLRRYDEALDYADAWIARAEAAGLDWAETVADNETKQRDLINAAIGAGQYGRAQAWLDGMNLSYDQSAFWKGLAMARLELARGAASLAASHVPPLSDARPDWTSLRRSWLEAVFAVARAGHWPNDDQLKASAQAIAEQCEANGMLRDAFNSYVECGLLTVGRGEGELAGTYLAAAARLRSQLQSDHGADTRLAELRAATGG